MTSSTGLEVFDTTIQKTNIWLNEIAQEMGHGDKRRAYQALRGTLHALRDRLTVEEVAQLGAQLPLLISGIYYEGWDPTDKPIKMRRKQEFLDQVSDVFRVAPRFNPEEAARAVFTVLARRISEGEIQDITSMLPEELRDLWPEEARR